MLIFFFLSWDNKLNFIQSNLASLKEKFNWNLYEKKCNYLKEKSFGKRTPKRNYTRDILHKMALEAFYQTTWDLSKLQPQKIDYNQSLVEEGIISPF